MTHKEFMQQIQDVPIMERLHLLELLIQSLKEDLSSEKKISKQSSPFTVQEYNLGNDAKVDRDELYSERTPKKPRPFGLCKGEFTVPDDFDAPLPEGCNPTIFNF